MPGHITPRVHSARFIPPGVDGWITEYGFLVCRRWRWGSYKTPPGCCRCGGTPYAFLEQGVKTLEKILKDFSTGKKLQLLTAVEY